MLKKILSLQQTVLVIFILNEIIFLGMEQILSQQPRRLASCDSTFH